jgi:hypothetical protein
MALFTDDELAAYPGTEGITVETTELLRSLAAARIYALVPQGAADVSDVAKGIALEVVARAFRNPGGYSSETVDDYTYRRDAATRSAGIYLTADERAELQGLTADTSRPRVRSVRLRSWSVPQL